MWHRSRECGWRGRINFDLSLAGVKGGLERLSRFTDYRIYGFYLSSQKHHCVIARCKGAKELMQIFGD